MPVGKSQSLGGQKADPHARITGGRGDPRPLQGPMFGGRVMTRGSEARWWDQLDQPVIPR